MASRGGSVLQAPCRSAGQPSAAQMPPRRCREAKSQLVFRLGFEPVPVVSPTGTHPAPYLTSRPTTMKSVICDVTEAMPINGLGAHKPCPLALDCMKACNTARAAKGGLRERSGAKGGEGGEGRLMASPRAASIPVGGRGRSRTRTPPPPESGPTHPGTVAGRAARRAGGAAKVKAARGKTGQGEDGASAKAQASAGYGGESRGVTTRTAGTE